MFLFILIAIIVMIIIANCMASQKRKQEEEDYKALESEALKKLGFSDWNMLPYFDEHVTVKSRQSLEKYDNIKFFKENREKLEDATNNIEEKSNTARILRAFLENNEFKFDSQYSRLTAKIREILENEGAYRIQVTYISSAGNNLGEKEICINQDDLNRFKEDPSLIMGKGEYTKYLKEQQKEALSQKQSEYYANINDIIDYANNNRDSLIIKGSQEKLDDLIAQIFDRTINSIQKIKTADSQEWDIIRQLVTPIKSDIEKLVSTNQKILEYYNSENFLKIKETCEVLMSSQREFNEYIAEKVQSISKLFGTNVVRNETIRDDKYNYIRPYKKTITPFTAELSAARFSSAENNPLDYVIKSFYPHKKEYPEQIRKLYQLVEELETLKDAKQIIENYKKEYQQYLGDVPGYIMENDEAGFYARLGFATIDESVLNVEYKFSYTSDGGLSQKSFTVPMTEENIVELIKALESKLTTNAFAKEQRNLMTKKLREFIKKRDNFTCCNCGNSIHAEPNLLLEIDHIIPVSKGGRTTEDNLQTLCWKCNRAKSNKLID